MSFYNYFFCFLLMMLTFSFCNFKPFFTRIPTFMKPAGITVHTPLFREVFWHKYAKIPRHTARIYAISINSVHREACYCARSEQ